MIDPAIWKNRAAITIKAATDRLIDGGAKIDEIENLVRSMRNPFSREHDQADIAVYRVWLAELDAVFVPDRRRPRKGRQS